MAYSQWYLVPEKGFEHGSIKRYLRKDNKTSWQRYPRASYKGLSKDETEALLRRLNATETIKRKEAIERYNFDHAYINLSSLKKFEEYVISRVHRDSGASEVMQILNDYPLTFFVLKHKLADPSEWYRKEIEFGQWLLSKNLKVSYMMRIISTTNRFANFLCTRVYPEMKNARKLEPIGKNKLKKLAEKTERKKVYISEDEFKALCQKISRDSDSRIRAIIPNLKLCYYLGLRISETLGLTKDKFFKTHVVIDEQGEGIGERREVKTKQRKTPYWYITGKEAWSLVREIRPMHSDTLNKRVNAAIEHAGLVSHDLRGSFITNALRAQHWRDVQEAVGHTDPRTTMGYAREDRDLDEDRLDLD